LLKSRLRRFENVSIHVAETPRITGSSACGKLQGNGQVPVEGTGAIPELGTARKLVQANRNGTDQKTKKMDNTVPVPGQRLHWKGNANMTYSFKNVWNNIYGFIPETVLLGLNVSAVDSWTAALATLENAGKTCKIV
jgi:hypothetical protein